MSTYVVTLKYSPQVDIAENCDDSHHLASGGNGWNNRVQQQNNGSARKTMGPQLLYSIQLGMNSGPR